jgi:hypothetical protein
MYSSNMDHKDGKSVLAVLLIWMLIIPSMDMSWAQQNNVTEIFAPDSQPFDLSYEDHIINFWKLMLSIPVQDNPMEDESGEICTYGQDTSNSSIFYLTANPGGISTKTCKIPSGLGVLIPIITVTASDGEVPGATPEELHDVARNDQDHVTSLYLNINGTELAYEDLLNFRTHTDEFQVTYPENALFAANPGPSTVVADGYYVITEPLEPGVYDIQFKGSLVCLAVDCIEPTFATENTIKLIVE